MSTAGKPSAARLGSAIGRDTRTARRILAGKQPVPFELIRDCSPKLWRHFLRCLVLNERKARVI